MLVLSRCRGESLEIGDNVKVTIIKSSSGGVRLGIDAPRSVKVIRSELTRDSESESDSPEGRRPAA